MPKFLFAYHGGSIPQTPEEGKKVMAAWTAWMGGIGSAWSIRARRSASRAR